MSEWSLSGFRSQGRPIVVVALRSQTSSSSEIQIWFPSQISAKRYEVFTNSFCKEVNLRHLKLLQRPTEEIPTKELPPPMLTIYHPVQSVVGKNVGGPRITKTYQQARSGQLQEYCIYVVWWVCKLLNQRIHVWEKGPLLHCCLPCLT